MKNKFSLALAALIIFSLALPVFVFAQQKPNQSNTAAGRTTGRTEPPAPAPGRRTRTHLTSNAVAAISQDFGEALAIIQDSYIDGKNLNYNEVYKSSIMGMLRTLDPHSNYFDKEEFDELKTDQRSEYFGIGAT
ncbi:MAG TPA: hypothetical protein VEL78_06915, partial [Pyrinomonadaceae bacterium]|nr:hypothetical protein [Pyrinomonadaceae bacterium]